MNPSIEHRSSRDYVGIRRTTAQRDVAGVLPPLVGEIMGWLASRNVQPAGAPFFRYHVVKNENHLEVEVGVPIKATVDTPAHEEIMVGFLPGGDYLIHLHVGPYDELRDATAELKRWALLHGLELMHSPEGTWEARLETYLTNPDESRDPAGWQTEIAILCSRAEP